MVLTCAPIVYDWRLAGIRYGLMLAVLSYVVGVMIIAGGGYQDSGDAVTATTTKLKGAALGALNGSVGMERVFDVYDLVQPPVEQAAVFLTTSVVVCERISLRVMFLFKVC